MTQHGHWSYSYTAYRLLCPIFLLGILSPFAFLGHPWPICFSLASLTFFLILLSHGLLLPLLGFPGSINLSFILGPHGLSISPLLSLLASLWACRGPFSVFYILPMNLLLLSLEAPLGPFASSGPILWARDPFILAIRTQWLFYLLILFCPHCWAFLLLLGFKNKHQQGSIAGSLTLKTSSNSNFTTSF